MAADVPARDPWQALRQSTPARIGLGRVGDAPPLGAMLDFQLAHARARDAVHKPLDVEALGASLGRLPYVTAQSLAPDRGTYLRRPDLGRKLDPACLGRLPAGNWDVVFVIADGLSAAAVQRHAAMLLKAALPRLGGWQIAPVVIVTGGRVAVGDEIGGAVGARLCAMLIGERPGLSVADSLGVYLTYGPRAGRRNSERNCISNIHLAGGLTYEAAAGKLVWLMTEARQRQMTGVGLKDEAPALAPAPPQLGGQGTIPAARK
ncbi:ethanolamine ammonia-lyase subunit EutC [Roseomonas marmotae]|uniref:Ethanolamine ammonia-lyase small subunit n=1 Tax=Roseomonas marmotae TaxID=2768161 RepID=A0ABS3KG88_9PROT|nr:ethanolamine ammonia-lyase subunit EutC [Roseomonas marmotae]MBO1075351.1 ethanolamine ammonia-lyase subunit EutC [Roseomonas marmotae]QTI78327.1 ethanolamine ammonia-lyase subunit EutC [Roseomonas marmotae]